ncbi:MAG TPA: lysophospholipid acyltransferase family protein [Gemmatimonadaceae bacterium]
MRTVLAIGTMLLVTPFLATIVIVAGLLGVPNRPGGLYDWAPRMWSRIALWAAGVRLVLHGGASLNEARPRVFVSNHVSWYDIFTLLAILPRYRFVAKAELFRIPLFGTAARRAGTIPIQRENRKAAFQAYDEAAREIRGGASVVVCPEGTRGDSYALRPFKKGPFVLAIAAQAPVVPLVIYGTREVQRKGSFVIRSATVHVRFLEEIPTTGLQYEDRDRLADECWRRMARALEQEHGVVSTAPVPRRERVRSGDTPTLVER